VDPRQPDCNKRYFLIAGIVTIVAAGIISVIEFHGCPTNTGGTSGGGKTRPLKLLITALLDGTGRERARDKRDGFDITTSVRC